MGFKVRVSMGLARKIIIWSMLVCVVTALFSALTVSFSLHSQDGMVYCPLQKKWVAQNPPFTPPPSSSPLNEICGSAKTKSAFSDELLGSLRLAFRQHPLSDITDLYFAYSKEGKAAFSRFGRLPNSPELPGNIFVSRDTVISTTQRNNVPATMPAIEEFDSYKETLAAAENPYFQREECRDLAAVGGCLQPRAPPLS